MCLSLQLHFQLIAKKGYYATIHMLKNTFDVFIRSFLKIHEFFLKKQRKCMSEEKICI